MKTFARFFAAVIAFASVAALPSCQKDPSPTITTTPEPGALVVRFDYVFGANQVPWQVGPTYVHTKTGDTLTFTTFKYYVSNMKLKKADGTWWAEPNSYHLVCANCTADKTYSIINLLEVPAGDYTAMEYTMGIDSARNVSGANTGDLSLANGMFWDWNSGYIMLKAEGNSPNSSTGAFAFHLGGFSGSDNIITVKTAEFGKTISINTKVTPVVKLLANPAKLWHSSPGLATRSTIHAPGPEAKTMAKDFYNNISFVSVE